MPKKVSIFALAFLTIISGFGSFLFFKKSNNKKVVSKNIRTSETQILEKKNSPEIIINNFELQQSLNKDYKWSLKSNKGKVSRKENKVECEKINFILFDKNNKVAKISANKSVFLTKEKRLELSGNIKSEFTKPLKET